MQPSCSPYRVCDNPMVGLNGCLSLTGATGVKITDGARMQRFASEEMPCVPLVRAVVGMVDHRRSRLSVSGEVAVCPFRASISPSPGLVVSIIISFTEYLLRRDAGACVGCGSSYILVFLVMTLVTLVPRIYIHHTLFPNRNAKSLLETMTMPDRKGWKSQR
ncbi:hypothetical protein BJX96DRAFT_12972 [Aspergillus floccosus]